jgi:hypothetical protein
MKIAVLSLLALSLPLAAQDGVLKQVTFCHGLEKDQSPKEKAESFLPDETIFLSVELKGRPKRGSVVTKFKIDQDLIAEAAVDVASVNGGVVLSVGQNTFAGFNLTHERPLPVGDNYSAEVSFDGKVLGTFPFRIAPPKGAIASKLKSTKFAKEVDDERQPLERDASLAPEDKVVLQGVADVGLGTWIRGTWYVNGQPDPKGTRSFTLEENKTDCDFFFSFAPATGWPKGKHKVSLVMNGKEIARPTFTVKDVLPHREAPALGKLEPASFSLLKSDAKGEQTLAVEAFDPKDLVLRAEWKLKRPTKGTGVQFVWTLVDADGQKNITIAKADLDDGTYRRMLTSLTTKNGLPVGKYRVDLTLNGEMIDSRPFEVR